MIIIVDGPDGAGKSTLVEKLQDNFKENAVTLHFGAPEPGEDQFMRYALPMATLKHSILIYDRSWISEFVYGPIMRNQYGLTSQQAALLDMLVQAHGGGVVIHMTADVDTLWDRCMTRGETYIQNKEQLEAIKNEYERVVPMLTKLPTVRIDTTKAW